MEVGSLVAVRRYSGSLWLFRVTRGTEHRLYVDLVEQPKGGWFSPANGKEPNLWVHRRDAIPCRDADHYAAIIKAAATFEREGQDIKASAAEKQRKARERYEAAIA